MKKFLVYLSLFVSLLLVVNFILLLIIKNIYRNDYEHYKSGSEGYLLADSHGLALHDETESFGVFNFSAGSESYTDMRKKVKYIIRDKSPKYILISADDHLLSPYRETLNNKDRAIFFTTVTDYNNPYLYFKERVLQYWFVLLNPKACLVFKEYMSDRVKGIISGEKSKSGKKSKKYSNWVELSEAERKRDALKRRDIQFVGDSISTLLAGELTEILHACKKNKIYVVGIKFPITREYYRAIGNSGFNVDSIFSGLRVPIYDFRLVYQDSTRFFKDQDHLNAMGGKVFSGLLKDSIISQIPK